VEGDPLGPQPRGHEALAGRLAPEYPSAAESIREGLDELFTVKELGLSDDLERALSATNAIENVNNGIRRITSRVKRWRGGSMILRLIGAALQELQGHFHRIKGSRRPAPPRRVFALATRSRQIVPACAPPAGDTQLWRSLLRRMNP